MATPARPDAGGLQPPGPWILPAPWWARFIPLLIVVPIGIGVALAAHRTPGQRAARLTAAAAAILKDGDAEQALVFARQSLELAPRDAETLLLVGRCLAAQGHEDEALASFRRAVAVSPSHYAANCALAAWEIDHGRPGDAEIHAANALRSNPQTHVALTLRAAARIALGDPAGALEDFAAAARDPDAGTDVALRAAWTAEFLAGTTWRDDYREAAHGAFAAAADAATSGTPASRALHGAALLGLGLHDLAARTVGADPEDDEGARVLAAALAARGDEEAAEIALRRAIAARRSPLLAEELVRLLVREQRLEAAALALREMRTLLGDEHALVHAEARLRDAVRRANLADTALVDAMTAPQDADDPFAPLVADGLLTAARTPEARRARLGCFGPAAIAAILGGAATDPAASRADADVAELLAADDRDVFALVWRGALSLARGDAEGALASLDEAVRAEPDRRQARHVRCLARAALGRWDAAAEDATIAWVTGEHGPSLAAARVRALHRAGRVAEAMHAGRAGLVEFPRDVALTAALRDAAADASQTDPTAARERLVLDARLALTRGDPRTALAAANTLLAESPDDVDGAAVVRAAWDRVATALSTAEAAGAPADPLRRAACLVRAGRTTAAADTLRSLAGRDGAAPAGIELARAFSTRGDLLSAAAVLREMTAGERDSAAVRLELGRVEMLMGRGDDAVRTWLAALARRDDAGVQTSCARHALMSASRADGTAAEVRRWMLTVTLTPASSELLEGWCRIADGEFSRAEESAEAARQLDPADPEPVVLAAAARLDAGDAASAETRLVTALSIAPGHPAARTMLAHARIRLGLDAATHGDVPAARGHWTGAVLGVPTDYVAVMLLAQSLATGGGEGAMSRIAAQFEERVPQSLGAPLLRAQWLRLAHRESEAFPCFREALAREPGNPIALAGMVETATRAAELDAAASACHVEIGRGDPAGFAAYHLGLVEEKTRDEQCAEKAYREALASNPANLPALGRLVPMLTKRGRADEARALLARAAAVPGGSSRRTLRVAELLAGAGDAAGAADRVEKILDRDQTPQTRFALAQLLVAAGDYRGAEQALEQILESAPSQPAPYLELFDVMIRQGHDADAERRFRRAADERPGEPAPLCVLGMLAERRGDLAAAESLYRRAVDASPTFSVAANNVAWLLADRLHRPAEALEFAAKAKSAAPSDPDVADTYGWVLHLNGQSERALAEIELACSLARGNAAHELHRAEILLALGRRADAVAAYAAATSIDSAFARATASAALARLGEPR
jgi:tetratricopeptide (TPR) repeat protein